MALMITVFLPIMLVIGGHGQPQELDPQNPTKKLLTAVVLFNGYYINIRNLPVGNMTFIPVEIPAFLPYPAFYLEESDNNVIYRQAVLVITEFDDGIVKLQGYNFTDLTKNTPNTFDVSALLDLDLGDFDPAPEFCATTFNLVDDNVMIGKFRDCKNRLENGQIPEYTMTVTCNAFSIVDTCQEFLQGAGRFVYDHRRCGRRYPYPSYLQEKLANFESPCDD